ncbi:MAG: universal stress protein [Flavobacteriaceae bacterium]|nr:universal stress protein [Flavobacteriaceae bacterium]
MVNVLIPTDFSENSWNAFQYAVRFFENEPVNFYLAHVHLSNQVDSEDVVPHGVVMAHRKSDTISKRLTEMIESLKNLFPNISGEIRPVVEKGLFIDGIRKLVDQHKINFIVMGTKGASGLKEVTIGSKTGDLITRVKCPTLVIPENAHYTSPKEIVFPTDFNIYFKNKILLTLAEIMAIHDSAIRVLNVNKEDTRLNSIQENNKDILEDFLTDKPSSFHFITHNSLEKVLPDFIDAMKIDMIAMVAKNINFFERLLFQPPVKKISYHTEIPFLVLHE